MPLLSLPYITQLIVNYEGAQEAACFFRCGCVEALTFFGEGVEGVINPVFATVIGVALFHGSFMFYRASQEPVPTR